MEYKADTNVVDDNRDTPLLVACRGGHRECLELLFTNPDNKPDVNSLDNAHESGVMLAAKNGHVNCLGVLLGNKDVKLMLNNDRGENALMLATEWNRVECAKLLLEHGINPDAKNLRKGGKTALHIACILGHAEIVKLLADNKANVNIQQTEGLTPLMCAVLRNRDLCVRHLLDAKADGNLADHEAITPAIMGCSKGSTECLKLLLEAGVDINTCDIYGGNCLTHAIKTKHWQCVDLLLAYGVFVGSIYNVHLMCGDEPEMCAKLTDLIYGAGGHNYVGEAAPIAHGKRIAEEEEKDSFQKKNIFPLYYLCKEFVKNGFAKKYPGTNLFPLVESLPVPVGCKRILLNGITLDIKIPLEKAVRCTAYPFLPKVCALCLRSEAELKKEDLTIYLCQCNIMGYCSERCDRNHWAMAHVAMCKKGEYEFDRVISTLPASFNPQTENCLVGHLG